MNFDFAELERRIANLVRIGVIVEADYAGARARVRCEGITSDWLPWMTRRAGGDVTWWAPETGEQVVVLAPSGLLESAVILPALYSDSHAEPAASPDIMTLRFANGDTVTHDRAAGSWDLRCAGPVSVDAGGTVEVTAGGAVTIKAPSVTLDAPNTICTGNLQVAQAIAVQGAGGGTSTTISGNVTVQGSINATGSVIDGGGNTNHHTH